MCKPILITSLRWIITVAVHGCVGRQRASVLLVRLLHSIVNCVENASLDFVVEEAERLLDLRFELAASILLGFFTQSDSVLGLRDNGALMLGVGC